MSTPSTVLQFSGGKDSLACLYLLRDQWDDITVAHVNTGARFPEATAVIDRVRALVPHFVEIQGRQSIAEHGWPVDLLPNVATAFARQLYKERDAVKFQLAQQCCAGTLWRPLWDAMREIGAKVVIRGTRFSDDAPPPVADGAVVEGIEYRFPIAHWTGEQVRDFLILKGVTPPSGDFSEDSSMDCWNCTAYLHHSAGRFKSLRKNYPERWAQVKEVLSVLQETSRHELTVLDRALA